MRRLFSTASILCARFKNKSQVLSTRQQAPVFKEGPLRSDLEATPSTVTGHDLSNINEKLSAINVPRKQENTINVPRKQEKARTQLTRQVQEKDESWPMFPEKTWKSIYQRRVNFNLAKIKKLSGEEKIELCRGLRLCRVVLIVS